MEKLTIEDYEKLLALVENELEQESFSMSNWRYIQRTGKLPAKVKELDTLKQKLEAILEEAQNGKDND